MDDALILPEMICLVKSVEFSDVVDEAKNPSFFAQAADTIRNCRALCCGKKENEKLEKCRFFRSNLTPDQLKRSIFMSNLCRR